MTAGRHLKPSLDVVRPLIAALYASRGEFCCLWHVLENGKPYPRHIDGALAEARSARHADCEHVAGLLRLMSDTQRSKLTTSDVMTWRRT